MRARLRSPGRRVVAILALAALLSACVTTVREHPQLRGRIVGIKNVSVMPAEATVTRIVFRGDNERLHDREKALEDALPGLAAGAFARHDFSVTPLALPDIAAADPDARFEATQAQGGMERALGELYQSLTMASDDAREVEKTLGPEVARFAEAAGADALLFMKLDAFEKSGGEIAKDVALTVLLAAATLGYVIVVQPTQGVVVYGALVDGSTGDVLWSNAVQGHAFSHGDVNGLVLELFEPFSR